MIMPLVPMKSTPLPSPTRRPASISTGRGGVKPPSYHINFTGGIFPRAGNSNVTIEAMGPLSSVNGEELACAEVGWPSLSAHTGVSKM
jgi:hypothetical protein